MTRLTIANNDAASADVVQLITMVKLDFAGGTLTAHDSVGTFAHDGDSYLGVGEFGGVDSITESLEFRPQPMRLTLSGVPQTAVDDLEPVNYQGRSCDIYLGLLSDSLTLADDPVAVWSGFMDYASLSVDQGAATIVVHCESRIIDFRTPKISRYTDVEQQALHPNDVAFEFVAGLQDQTLNWGGSRINGTPRGGVDTVEDRQVVYSIL